MVILATEEKRIRQIIIRAWQLKVIQAGYMLFATSSGLFYELETGSALWAVGDGHDNIVKQACRSVFLVFLNQN